MALVSPGVQVNVIDESFYTPAEPGTTPLIFIATKQNKPNPGGTGIAPGTLAANAEKLYLISSQRELSETFGDATFYTDENNNPIHGSELNEYGLQAAYSFLGVSNRAYVIRANLDLASISPLAVSPAGRPAPGSYWYDVGVTRYGIFEWNASSTNSPGGQTFTNKLPLVITDPNQVADFEGEDYTPRGSVGIIGDYAVVAVTTVNRVWYKNFLGTWVLVGSPEWRASWPTVVGVQPVSDPTVLSEGDQITINSVTYTVPASPTNDVGNLVDLIVATPPAGVSPSLDGNRFTLYTSGDQITISGDSSLLSALGIDAITYRAPKLEINPHTVVPQFKLTDTNPRPTGSLWIKTTSPNLGAQWSVKRYNAELGAWEAVVAPIYPNGQSALAALDPAGGGANLTEGTLFVKSNVSEEDPNKLAEFKLYRRAASGPTVIRSVKIDTLSPTGAYTFQICVSQPGTSTLTSYADGNIDVTINGTASDAEDIASLINSKGIPNLVASVDSQNRLVVSHTTGGEIRFLDVLAAPGDPALIPLLFGESLNTGNIYESPNDNEHIATLWAPLIQTASRTEPRTEPASGTLWYSSIVDEVDIMVHDGVTWKGYGTEFPNTNTTGPIVSATAPISQTDGSALVENDLWISTADVENYPLVYKYIGGRWEQVDKTDQTTENGILFADARYNTSGANSSVAGEIAELRNSSFLDPDAPDPALYPRGMLLWNLRRSGFNVKRYERDYINTNELNIRFGDESMNGYASARWVTESRNNEDGSGSFGRNAQRKVVVQALQAMVNSNQDIRDDESRVFNLMAAPGYPELIGEMINLNFDRGLTAFIVGDSPMRLRPETTLINNWANNINQAVEDNDLGLVSRDEYLGIYYPSGFTSDNRGNNIVVPASHMVLRTIALNDQVAYPWFAPAGTRRGGVTNATSAGYISSEGEFVPVSLNEGQRDTLYQANVNPITFITGAGLVVFGQKTRARNASALDRVNVARLVIYLRRQLSILAKPYLFEPNDKITRDEIKGQVESLLIELVGLRGLYDYLVVCDESNNTPARIDRNELWVDIAIEPVKAVEFIYIPLRLKNTGEIASL